MNQFKKYRILKSFGDYKAGQSVMVRVDDYGTPIDINWRRILKDAEIDGAVEAIKPTKKKKETKE